MKPSFRVQHPIEGQQTFWALTQFATLTAMVTWCYITKFPWKKHHLWSPSLRTSRDSARTAETCSFSVTLATLSSAPLTLTDGTLLRDSLRWVKVLLLVFVIPRLCKILVPKADLNPCPALESEWLEKFLHRRPHLCQWRTLHSDSLLFTAWQRPN